MERRFWALSSRVTWDSDCSHAHQGGASTWGMGIVKPGDETPGLGRNRSHSCRDDAIVIED